MSLTMILWLLHKYDGDINVIVYIDDNDDDNDDDDDDDDVIVAWPCPQTIAQLLCEYIGLQNGITPRLHVDY